VNDQAFLAEIESWWAVLASALAQRNPRLPPREAQPAARRVVETLVFLHMGQQRGLLPGQTLDTLIGGGGADRRLGELLQVAEHRLGAGLFQLPSNGDPRHVRNAGFPNLRIDGKTLLAVVSALSASGSAPDRAARPAEFLGTIHEHLLGKRLRPGSGGRFRVETSPEVKKKSGVFYTPGCVTEYIVRNSVGGWIEARPANAGGDSDLKILDPACGCGSFLVAACRYLLARSGRRQLPDAAASAAKHLYGVDIDPDAVLTTRRSLWLEMAAGRPRSDGQGHAARRVADRSLVDDLAKNIRCGNMLTESVLDESPGRFDVVVGNPPYRRELNGKPLLDRIAATELGRRYRAPRMDLWYYFVHRSLELLKAGGRLSFIVGSYWTSGPGADKLLAALRESVHVDELFLLDGLKVFPKVTGRHMILTLTKGTSRKPTTIKRAAAGDRVDAEPFLSGTAPVVVFLKTPRQLFRAGRIDVEPPCDSLLAKLARWPRLGSLGKVRQGIVENPATVTRKTNERHGSPWRPGEGVFALTREELDGLELSERELRLLRPYHDLCDLGRYSLAEEPSRMLIYSTAETCADIDRYPAIRAHLARFRPIMEARRETRQGVRPWWQLHWPRDENLWRSPKVIALQMARRPAFVPATGPVYVPFSVNVFVAHGDTREHLNYFTALLNSRLMWKWYGHHAKRRGVGLEINGHVLAQTPIRTVDFSNPAEKARHDRLVALVEEMLRLSRQLREGPDGEGTEIDQHIRHIDGQLDSLVYGLYRLTDPEVAIVEGASPLMPSGVPARYEASLPQHNGSRSSEDAKRPDCTLRREAS